jgi:SAM-dependent methyltransferase
MNLNKELYYLAYEKRYQAVFSAGAERWGHAPDDPELFRTLSEWLEQHNLKGKRILEFACGEGASGVILSQLGCTYYGVDIAPSAVEKAKAAIAGFPLATVSLLDMVNDKIQGEYDAAIDIMGYHMLITDDDRQKYLANAISSLKPGAPMLFYRESYRQEAYDGEVNSYDEWIIITGDDYITPQLRRVMNSDITVNLPLVPGRARTKDGYLKEFINAGFIVDGFFEMDMNEQIQYSATIFVHKPSL